MQYADLKSNIENKKKKVCSTSSCENEKRTQCKWNNERCENKNKNKTEFAQTVRKGERERGREREMKNEWMNEEKMKQFFGVSYSIGIVLFCAHASDWNVHSTENTMPLNVSCWSEHETKIDINDDTLKKHL